MDREDWDAAVHGVTDNRTQLSEGTELKHINNFQGGMSSRNRIESHNVREESGSR